MERFERLIYDCVRDRFSDVHITGCHPVVSRKHGFINFDRENTWSHEEVDALTKKLLNARQMKIFKDRWSVDLGLSVSHVRLRMNVFNTTRGISIAIRILPGCVPNIASLNLHPSIQDISQVRSGLVLVCGSTGSGKSTTMAAVIDEINANRASHIITLEDPIEYRFISRKSFVEQRELGTHIPSFEQGLLDVLREDPDVILVGELREPETIRLALNAAESGHLVIASLHASNFEDAIYRILNAFPHEAKQAIHHQLAATLSWLIVQRLEYITRLGFRVPQLSILRGTPAVRSIIREDKLAQLESAVQTARGDGMFTMDGYMKYYIEKLTSFTSPFEIFTPSLEPESEVVYQSPLAGSMPAYTEFPDGVIGRTGLAS